MAIAVRGYYEVSNWYATGTTNTTTGVAWESGDVIVVAQWNSDGTTSEVTAPTNANLTFTSRQDSGAAFQEAQVLISTATAGSTQTGQTITTGRSGTTNANGAGVWVLSGADAYRGGWQNRLESATSYDPLDGSAIINISCDWNAAGSTRSGTTGSGTLTEREDSIDASWGGVWAGDWVGTTAGSTTYGLTDYTGMKAAKAAVEITAAAGAASGSGAPSLVRHTAAGSGATTAPSTSGSGLPTLARHTAAGAGVTVGTIVPQNLALTFKDDDQVDMSWDAVAGATGYDIERNGTVIVFDHATTSYSDTGLSPSTEYTHRVRAVF